MTLSFDEVGEILDQLAEKIPEPFYQGLNGGILLLPEEHTDPKNGPDMYVFGEYRIDGMGRYINIYYGSFAAMYADEPREVWEEELFKTLRHEFTHHVEELAGEYSLEREDEDYLQQCRKDNH